MKSINVRLLLMGFLLLALLPSCKKDSNWRETPETIPPVLISPEIQRKVDSILKSQRDSILKANGVISYKFAPPPGDVGGGGPCSNHATAGITGTSNGITVNITANNGSINSVTYSISGLHGTITQVGSVIQSVHQGVITYQLILSGTWRVNGVYYTTNVLIYGNFYNCQATVGGMTLTP